MSRAATLEPAYALALRRVEVDEAAIASDTAGVSISCAQSLREQVRDQRLRRLHEQFGLPIAAITRGPTDAADAITV